MRVAVITKGIATTEKSTVGGGDVFNVFLIRALKELGHKVILSTTRATHWDTIERDLGWAYIPDLELVRSPSPLRGKAKSLTQLVPPLEIRALKRACDITFNTYGDNLLWDTDLSYMLSPPTKEQIAAKYASATSRLYYKACHSIFNVMKRSLHTRVLTDSFYAKKVIEETIGVPCKVLYLPVNCEYYSQALRSNHRLNHIVSVGRLTWEKNFGIIPELATKVRGATFHIVGSVTSNESHDVIQHIKRRSRDLNVGDRVKIHLDTSTAERFNILEQCKVYVNCWKHEYFGIVVAEAMSAGLTPVVPDNGGQVEVAGWQNTYQDLEEAAGKVQDGLSGWSRKTATRFSKSAERFNFNSFKVNLATTLMRVLCG